MTETELEAMRLRRENRDLERRIEAACTARTSEEIAALDAIQRRAESVTAKFGEAPPMPRPGERPHEFRVRVLERLQGRSPEFADFDLARADSALLAVAEREIFKAAEEVARSGLEAKQPLVRVDEKNEGGQTVSSFYGDPLEWMRPFMGSGTVCRITRPGFSS